MSHDEISNPKHYDLFPDGMQAIDVIRAALTPEEFAGYLNGNFLKYRLRAGEKGPAEKCLGKAEWCRDRLADHHDFMASDAITRAEHAKLKAEDSIIKSTWPAGLNQPAMQVVDWPNELRRQDAEDVTIWPTPAPADSGSPWMEWNGGVRPVQSVTIIEVHMRDGETEEGLAGAFGWSHRGEPTDIVAWRETWPEARMDVIGQNGPTGEHYAKEEKPRSRHCKACGGPCELTA